jgi:hypothetical protein
MVQRGDGLCFHYETPASISLRDFVRAQQLQRDKAVEVTVQAPRFPFQSRREKAFSARDAYVAWQGSRYSVPWSYAGKQVWVPPPFR